MNTLYRLILKNLRRLKVLLQPFYMRRSMWTCPVVHIRKLTNLPAPIALPLICGRSKGKLKCPSDLTILLIHNYTVEPIMEKSLRYVGVEDYVVLTPVLDGPWKMAIKLIELKKYLDSNACKTKYILYMDSDDAALRDDPAKTVQYLEEEDCDLLFPNTGWTSAYDCMPEVKRWADQDAARNGVTQRYINAGVFVGKTDFLKEVVDKAMEYVSDDDLPSEEYWRILDEGNLRDRLPEFPKRVGCDQEILRYLHPQFHPRMKVDYKDRLAIR
jgi:hypothetical protein